ncbi:MAG: glycerophosphodiester phosphodiesterase [Gammaproteobacteria bacterium]|nr:MAG: glycerophosphodiester phosphodiesterase [Gammaproteobacteria bacterium]
MLADRLVAHRGYPKHYPENTLLGMAAAIDAGARFIETDILFSADQQPVLYHDALMTRVSGEENAIHLLTLDELVCHPASEPQRLGEQFVGQTITPLCDLVSLLEEHPDVIAFIEMKRSGLHIVGLETAYDIVTRILAPVADRCVLISFSDEFIDCAHQQGYTRLGLVLKDWEERGGDLIQRIQPEFIFCDAAKVPDGAALDDIDATLVIYEVEEPDQAIAWFERGADMVETFDIGGMLENLAHRAL